MIRLLYGLGALAAMFLVGMWAVAVSAADELPPPAQTVTVTVPDVKEERRLVRERDQARKDANARGRTIRRLKRELQRRYQPSAFSALALASVAYGVSHGTLVRKARCESRFNPFAYNSSSGASGLMQFLPSTWRSTPYAAFSIFDPYANALAAGWMHRVGRGGEWSCR